MSYLDGTDAWLLLRLETEVGDQTIDGIIAHIRQRYGLSNSIYLCPSFRGGSLVDPFVATSYSTEWTEHYKARGYVFIDPVNTIWARSLPPLDSTQLPRRSTKARHLFGEAKDAGVGRQEITIPVRGPTNGLRALFSVASDEADLDWAARHFELVKELIHIAKYVRHRAFELHDGQATLDLNAVTQREIEALEWAAEGKSIQDMAILTRISAATVRAHLDSVRYKLQALNRVHTVAKAIRAGLIH